MGKKPNKFKAGGDGAGEQGDEDLAAEVAAFASSLGLGGGGGGGGGAFDDFAPEKAGKKLAPRDGERVDRDRAEAKAKGNKAKNPKAEKGGEAADGGRGKQKGENNEGGKKASQSEPPKASKRDWNFGAGPRPGRSAP